MRGEKVFLISRATVFDQIYVFYLRSANPGISGPTFDDIYALEHTTKDGERESVKLSKLDLMNFSKHSETKPFKSLCLMVIVANSRVESCCRVENV